MTYKNSFSHAISHLVLGVTQLQFCTALKASERFTISCACAQRRFQVLIDRQRKKRCAVAVLHIGTFRFSLNLALQLQIPVLLLMQLFRQEGARPFTIFYNCVTSRTNSRCLIEDQPSSRRTGAIWSNFQVLVKTRAAKFCTSCGLRMLCLKVPDHAYSRTIEELTKNQAVQNTDLENRCLTLLI